jgi:hypothetical protein
MSADDVGVLIRESAPNCPKYIQRRHAHERSTTRSSRNPTEWGCTVDEERRALVETTGRHRPGISRFESGFNSSWRPPCAGQEVFRTSL